MAQVWFAHSLEGADRSRWELLKTHLENVARAAAHLAAKFGAGDLGTVLGLLHDLGKYDERFLRRLDDDAVRHEHSIAGAQMAIERYPRLGKLLAYAIAGHHAGLADWARGEGEPTRGVLSERLGRKIEDAKAAWERAEADGLALPGSPSHAPLQGSPGVSPGFTWTFFGRMLFSCLVDADFIETERFYAEAGEVTRERGNFAELSELRQSLDAYLARKLEEAREEADTPVNRIRAALLQHVRGQAERDPGVFTLTVPTGGGKTLTSLAFALDHAIRHGLDRVVYVIPFTSIVEQTAGVFRDALAPHSDSVLEYHSAFDEAVVRSREARHKLDFAMENWDAPIVVTTAVQFFESLFADRPSRCRKLHNLTRSVIVLDEAQTLPIPLLRPCVAALDELARNYRASIVLCTATQPALRDDGDAARSFRGGFRNTHELAPDLPALFTNLSRVTLEHAGRLTDAEIANRLAASEQALIIVNTRAHARALYEQIRPLPGARHLSTLMCAMHRRQVLDAIRADLKSGRPCRIVSTSLIEAGVDVDFPLVLRAEAGLEQIAQAAGRCNREGKRDREASRVVVFEPADIRTPDGIRQHAQAAREILDDHRRRDPFTPEVMDAYFRLLYWQKGDAGPDRPDPFDRPGVLRACRDGGIRLEFPYETVARDFRMIDDLYVPVIVPYDDKARQVLDTIPYAKGGGGIARKLQPYTVGIGERSRRELIRAGAAVAIDSERFGEQFVRLLNTELYGDDIGLDASDPLLREAARLVV